MRVIREVNTYYDRKIMLVESQCRAEKRVNGQRTVSIKLVNVNLHSTYKRADQHGCKIFLEYLIPVVDKDKINLVCEKLNKIIDILYNSKNEFIKLNKMR